MRNTNDAYRTYTDDITAQLGERVTNLGRRQADLEAEMRTGSKGIDAASRRSRTKLGRRSPRSPGTGIQQTIAIKQVEPLINRGGSKPARGDPGGVGKR